ncbi:MAG: WD40 repeat domain-containing protein, partial [Pirellulaceae bacterium]
MTKSFRIGKAGRIALSICMLAFVLGCESSARGADWTSRILAMNHEHPDTKPSVITSLALHPDGRIIAVAGDDHCVRLLDLDSGQLVLTLTEHVDWVRSLAFSPTGRVLASAASDGRIVLWDPTTGNKLKDLAELPYAITAICFSHDGKQLAATGFGEVW